MHNVPSWWCEKLIDTSLIPIYGEFMVIPPEYCHKDFKIHVKKQAGKAFVKMAEQAAKDSIFLKVRSGFRSIAYQTTLFKKYMKDKTPFDTVALLVAPPGYSEHHTGQAFDLASDGIRFDKSPAYEWLKENASKFGFIESFPYDTTSMMKWEPWHWFYDMDE